jgi:hypothetical protein
MEGARMFSKEQVQHQLEKKIEELEDLLQQLRLGRRVLMNLLEMIQNEQNEKLAQLEKENEWLRRKNRKYAERLMEMRWRK